MPGMCQTPRLTLGAENIRDLQGLSGHDSSRYRQDLQWAGHFLQYIRGYHESLDNLTPADVYYGRGQEILDQRETIKLNTLAMRRKMHYDNRNNLKLMG